MRKWIGILLGNFVPSTGRALEKGQFVGVSIPIGKIEALLSFLLDASSLLFCLYSNWSSCHDVSDSLQGQVRRTSPGFLLDCCCRD